MAFACRYCIAKHGLRGKDIHELPQTEDELIEHIERVHHMPVRRDGETTEQAQARFIAKYPEAAKCVECRQAGAPWTKGAKDEARSESG